MMSLRAVARPANLPCRRAGTGFPLTSTVEFRPTPVVLPFAAADSKRFDGAPPLFAAEAYDAVGLIAARARGLGREV